MKEFLQAVLISLALTFPVFWMSNGFALSPKTTTTTAPAMDMTMPGMDHGTGAATPPPQDESVPHSH